MFYQEFLPTAAGKSRLKLNPPQRSLLWSTGCHQSLIGQRRSDSIYCLTVRLRDQSLSVWCKVTESIPLLTHEEAVLQIIDTLCDISTYLSVPSVKEKRRKDINKDIRLPCCNVWFTRYFTAMWQSTLISGFFKDLILWISQKQKSLFCSQIGAH